MRAVCAAIVLTSLFAVSAYSEEPLFVGERGLLNAPFEACNSFQDWARFEILRYREFDDEAAVKFLDQHCSTIITGPVIVEKIERPPPDLHMLTVAVCLRPVGSSDPCLWLDSGWLIKTP